MTELSAVVQLLIIVHWTSHLLCFGGISVCVCVCVCVCVLYVHMCVTVVWWQWAQFVSEIIL